MTINNDQSIIDSILKGDTKAFSKLVVKYKDLVFTLALRMLKNKEEAEEVSQDVFIKVYKSLSKFKGEAKFSTWLYRVTYNACLDTLKKYKKQHHDISIDQYDTYNLEYIDASFEKLDTEIRAKTVKACIDALPSEDGFLLTLYYLEELTLKEISKIVGLVSNNVKVKIFRARKKLMAILKQRLDPDTIEYYER